MWPLNIHSSQAKRWAFLLIILGAGLLSCKKRQDKGASYSVSGSLDYQIPEASIKGPTFIIALLGDALDLK